MKTIAAVLFFIFPTTSLAQTHDALGHYDIFVIFDPAVTQQGMYEILDRIEFLSEATSPDTDESGPACVIHLYQEEILPGQGVPLDESGQQMILLDDDLTWLPSDGLIDLAVSEDACRISFVGV